MVLTTIAPFTGPRQGASPPLAAAAAPHTLAVANAALRSGFVLLPRTILHAAGLSRDAKLLYAVLLSYAWQEGSCFPGYERLKADLGCGINQITKYLRELDTAGLISRHRRGQGKTNVYTINDLPGLTPREAGQIHQNGETSVTAPVKAQPLKRRREQDSAKKDPDEQQQSPQQAAAPPICETAATDAVVALLLAQGVTAHVARSLASTHPAAEIQQQVAWHAYRTAVDKNPAGALVKAIRERWAPPQVWLDAKERETTIARREGEERARAAQLEEERRRREALPPEEQVRGRLEFWKVRQRLKLGREPTEAEIAERQVELIAQLTAGV